MLLALPWVRRRDPALLPLAAAFLGLAVLAKGPVALVLACPILMSWKGLAFLRPPSSVVPFLLAALPWYALCTWANGAAFPRDFFWKHNVERFVSSTAVGQHGQPWWYFGPVLLALLLPWTPLLPLTFRRAFYSDAGRLFLLAWAVLWLVFFSLSANKLPSYILPAIPAAAALLGVAVAEVRDAAPWLAACAVLLPLSRSPRRCSPSRFPPDSRTRRSRRSIGRGCSLWPSRSWPGCSTAADAAWRPSSTIAAGATIGTVVMKNAAAPDLDRLASARALRLRARRRGRRRYASTGSRAGMQYSLDYYFVPPLPDCAQDSRSRWLHNWRANFPRWARRNPLAGELRITAIAKIPVFMSTRRLGSGYDSPGSTALRPGLTPRTRRIVLSVFRDGFMILPHTDTALILLMCLCMLCWGSWPALYKSAKNLRFELFYFDFAFGFGLVALVAPLPWEAWALTGSISPTI